MLRKELEGGSGSIYGSIYSLKKAPCGFVMTSENGIVTVTSVSPGLPADKAGIKVGDGILSIATKKIRSATEGVARLQDLNTWDDVAGSKGSAVETVIEIAAAMGTVVAAFG